MQEDDGIRFLIELGKQERREMMGIWACCFDFMIISCFPAFLI